MDQTSDHQIKTFNQNAWNLHVKAGNRWTVPVSSEQIARARSGHCEIALATKRPVPRSWLGDLRRKDVLGLAAGGGQQGPLLAAAGAKVTIVDLSDQQLAQDRKTAEREGLTLNTIHSGADDLSMLSDASFDLIIHPVSNCFFPQLAPVWRECARVLRPGGLLLYGFNNPIAYCFDFEKANRGKFEARYPLPFADTTSFSEEEKKRFLREENPLEFSHTLTEQLEGMLRCGFVIEAMYEEGWDPPEPIDRYFPQFIVVKARRKGAPC